MMQLFFVKTILLFLLITVSNHSSAQESQTETILEMEKGDIACYILLQDGNHYQHREKADFEVCEYRQYIGHKVKVTYGYANVLAESCQGNMDCGRTERVRLVSAIEPLSGVAQNVPSHCDADETVIFSCNTFSNRLISVCASQNFSKDSGYFQYRFGASGHFPEFVFPMNHDIASKFFYSGMLMYSGGGGAYIKFRNGSYSYTVYTGIGRGWKKEGLVINNGPNEIARYQCNGNYTSELGPDLFQKAGLYEDKEGFGIPLDYDE